MVKYGMVIDLGRCIGCRSCMMACKAENNTGSEVTWMYVFRQEIGEYPNVSKRFMPRPCMHCEKPSCTEVCPTQARHKRLDNYLVLTNYSKCIGCRYCMVACPYGVNYFNWKAPDKNQYFDWENGEGDNVYGKGSVKETIDDVIPPNKNPDVSRLDVNTLHSRYIGVVEKCTFCQQRIDKGLNKHLTPGIDREATPACVITCPVTALNFGDLDDPESNVSKLLKSRRWSAPKDEFGTHPQVYYIV